MRIKRAESATSAVKRIVAFSISIFLFLVSILISSAVNIDMSTLAVQSGKSMYANKSIFSDFLKDKAFINALPFLSGKTFSYKNILFSDKGEENGFLVYNQNVSDVLDETALKVVTTSLAAKSDSGYLVYEGVRLKNNSTKDIKLESIMAASLSLAQKKNDGPKVLVYHSHATESFNTHGGLGYYASESIRSEDNTKNMVGIGEIFCRVLKENGVECVHITEQFDNPNYTGSYDRSLVEINKALEKYPSIQVVLDLHRDSIVDNKVKYRPVTNINGTDAAQIMFVVGTGKKTSPNEHWQDNLRFATLFQEKITQSYPKLCRAILIRDARYNAHTSKGALLIEMGSCGNTFEDVSYTAKLIAPILADIIKEDEKQ